MAAGGPVKELCDEATCSVCLEFFRDPVAIAECGHSFCRACLTQSWGESGAETSCPQCRGRAQEGSLRPNQQLASFVEIIKKFSPQGGKEAEAKGREGKEGVCEKHQEPLDLFCKDDEAPICVVCSRSKEHEIITADEKVRVCEKHQKPLKLFCKDDEAPLCVVCDRSKEHKFHEVIPLEEAAEKYKDDICSFLEILKKKRAQILAFTSDVVKESQDLMKQTKADKQKAVAEFRQLHKFLEIQEKHLLSQAEELEKEISRERDEHLERLSGELSSLESLIQEMKEKILMPPCEFLQEVRSLLQRFEGKEKFEAPVAFPLVLMWKVWDYWDISTFLEGLMKQFKDTLVSGLQLQKAKVTLDPDTAHPQLLLSEDRKNIRETKKRQDLPHHPERFCYLVSVLGCEGFTKGRYFWEIIVGQNEEWAVGVARKSVRRKESAILGPEGGIWAVGKMENWDGGKLKIGSYMALTNPCRHNLGVNVMLKRIRVALNCAGGQVAFFDNDTAALLYTFSGASFSGETLLPFFWVHAGGHLQLPP